MKSSNTQYQAKASRAVFCKNTVPINVSLQQRNLFVEEFGFSSQRVSAFESQEDIDSQVESQVESQECRFTSLDGKVWSNDYLCDVNLKGFEGNCSLSFGNLGNLENLGNSCAIDCTTNTTAIDPSPPGSNLII